jgi:4-amino-4-deoxy-L-arabinose transferase-like glycosyltransferase
VATPYLHFPFFNEFTEMLFTATLGSAGELCAQQVSWLSNLLILLGIYSCLKSFASARAGIIGAGIWLSSELAAKLSATAFVDINLCLFCLATAYSALATQRENERSRSTFWWLTGLFGGFAISIKYTGIVFLGGTALALLVDALTLQKLQRRRMTQPLCVLLVAFVVASPWFIRNYIYTHNPVFPFLPNVFGLGGFWSMDDYRRQIADFRSSMILNLDPATFLFVMPWYLSFKYRLFGGFVLAYSIMFFPTFYAGLAFSLNRVRPFAILVLPSILFLAMVFVTSQNPRYALPVLPSCALYGGWALEICLNRFNPSVLNASANTAAACALAFLMTFTGAFGRSKAENDWCGKIPLSAKQKSSFLTSQMSTYPAYEFLNAGHQRGALYALCDGRMSYYYRNGEFLGDTFGPCRYDDVLPCLSNGHELLTKMQNLHAKYFLFSNDTRGFALPTDEFFKQHFIQLLKDSNFALFEIRG